MFRLVERRAYYFLFSGLILTIGIGTLIYSTVQTGQPLQLGIDFTGGTIFELQFIEAIGEQEIRDVFTEAGYEELVVQELNPLETESLGEGVEAYPEGSRWSVRTEEASVDEITLMLEELQAELAPLDEEATSTNEVSGTVGQEVTQAAILATIFGGGVVLAFVWFAFRKVPNAYRYGACAIVAMVHDLLIMITAMSIFGLVLGWQADALFLTAMLTVLGFSVQDTIVVFDRIRENIPRRRGESYELIVNRSVLETVHRSLATQLNAMFIMVALVLFGGETTRQFIIIMLIGLTSGTYSSIFIAVPLLVSWEKGQIPFLNREAKERPRSTVVDQTA
ncbi:MAG: protein translocase subunit SecF [Anaerolineales bacterium]